MSLGAKEQKMEGMKRQAQELIEQAYQRGYNAGYEEGKGQTWSEEIKKYEIEPEKALKYIEQGRNEAWEAAKKILIPPCDGGLATVELKKIFGESGAYIFNNFTVSEAIEKIRAYDEKKKQKEDEEIKVDKEKVIKLADEIGIHKLFSIVKEIRGE